jgi:hypothetical protein
MISMKETVRVCLFYRGAGRSVKAKGTYDVGIGEVDGDGLLGVVELFGILDGVQLAVYPRQVVQG